MGSGLSRHPKGAAMAHTITPNLWFDKEAEEAANYYCSIFDNSRIVHVARYPEGSPGPTGEVMVVSWELNGQRFTGINGGAEAGFKFSEAVSFQIDCKDQEEVDYYWEKLTDGGEEGPCGWCKDRYGLSWQVTPRGMDELFSDPDRQRSQRAMQAMLKMKKLDIAELRAAADGVPAAS
jgi:predicted 3-demethylubiquinone-9 3-methyltransferase (glyoxalase superfamily)